MTSNPRPFRVLINGAGVCGPALACCLLHTPSIPYAITCVERSPSLRTGGQQIDLRDHGIPIMRKLNLLEKVKAKTVPEQALVFVNGEGKQHAYFGVNDTGKGPQAFVSEYEIMRGDLVEVLYDESLRLAKERDGNGAKGGGGEGGECLKYEFGKYATEIIQDDHSTSVVFSDGSTGKYDLVVGCDGLGSKTRRLAFPKEVHDAAFRSKDLFIALWNMPKSAEDEKVKQAIVYQAPGRKAVNIRTAAEGVTQAMLAIMGQSELLRGVWKEGPEEQKRAWETLFKGTGWETERLLRGMWESDDFYMSEIGQVKMDSWVRGRVVLLGDAGYCPSPISGMGTTASLVGAYYLAGELANHVRLNSSGDGYEGVVDGLAAYDKNLRPFVKSAQSLPPGVPGIVYPQSAWGITILNWVLWTVWILKIDRFFAILTPSTQKETEIPEYSGLELPGAVEKP